LNLVFQRCFRKALKEHLVDCHVERGDNFLWVIDELTVQILIKVLQMFAVHVQERIPNGVDLKTRAGEAKIKTHGEKSLKLQIIRTLSNFQRFHYQGFFI
jgi:hypothetical protein